MSSSYAAHSMVNVWSQNYATTFLDVNKKAVEKKSRLSNQMFIFENVISIYANIDVQ